MNLTYSPLGTKFRPNWPDDEHQTSEVGYFLRPSITEKDGSHTDHSML